VITYTMDDTFDREVFPLSSGPTRRPQLLPDRMGPKPDAPPQLPLERHLSRGPRPRRALRSSAGFPRQAPAHAWACGRPEHPVEVELRFHPDVARRVKETTWHEARGPRIRADVRWRVRLVWGPSRPSSSTGSRLGCVCEVVSPGSFREEVAQEAATMAALYSSIAPRSARRLTLPAQSNRSLEPTVLLEQLLSRPVPRRAGAGAPRSTARPRASRGGTASRRCPR